MKYEIHCLGLNHWADTKEKSLVSDDLGFYLLSLINFIIQKKQPLKFHSLTYATEVMNLIKEIYYFKNFNFFITIDYMPFFEK